LIEYMTHWGGPNYSTELCARQPASRNIFLHTGMCSFGKPLYLYIDPSISAYGIVGPKLQSPDGAWQ